MATRKGSKRLSIADQILNAMQRETDDVDYALDDVELFDEADPEDVESFLNASFSLPDGREIRGRELYDEAGGRIFSMSPEEAGALAQRVLARKRGQAAPAGPRWTTAAALRGETDSLESSIEVEFTAAQLRELGKFWNIPLRGTIKSALAAQVIEGLMARRAAWRTPGAPDLLQPLAPDQAEFLRRLFTAWDSGLAFPRSLAKELLRTSDDRRVNEMLEGLRRRALIFPTRSYQYMINARDAFYQLMPLGPDAAFAPGVSTAAPAVARPPAKDTLGATQPMLGAVDAVLNAILSTPLPAATPLPPHPQAARTPWLADWAHDAAEAERVLKSRPGWVPDPRTGISVVEVSLASEAAFATLESQTGLPVPQARVLVAMLCAMQMLSVPVQASPVLRVSPEAYEAWIGLDPAAQLRKLWDAYTTLLVPPVELTACNGLRGGGQRLLMMRAIGARDLTVAQLGADLCAMRRFVARVLRGLTPGVWHDWAAIRNEMFALRADCAHTLRTPDDWWFAQGTVRLNPAKFEEWLRSIGALIERTIATGLLAFGAVEVVLNADDTLARLSVTPLGAWLFGAPGELPAEAAPSERIEEPAAWLGDLVWRVPPSPARVELITLSRKLGEPADVPFTYRFTPRSLEHALAQGINLEAAAAVFARFGMDWPPAARAMAAELSRNFGRLRVYDRLSLITFADDLALRELLASTALRRQMIVQLSPRAVAVREDGLDALIEEMIAKGFTPSIEEGAQDG